MYRAKRTQEGDGKVNLHHMHRIVKNLKVEIDDRKYKFEVNGIAISNNKGEAITLSVNICGRPSNDVKIEISCKGHTIESWTKKSCFGRCCGLRSREKYQAYQAYQEVTGKMDFKKISNTFFDVIAVGRPIPYPTINAEITFPCGTIYYIRISWKKDYGFTVDLEGPAIYVR